MPAYGPAAEAAAGLTQTTPTKIGRIAMSRIRNLAATAVDIRNSGGRWSAR